MADAKRLSVIVIAWLVAASGALAAEASRWTELPEQIDAERRYLFYLHGAIVERGGPGVEHPRFGRYDYEAVADAFTARGFTVISEARPSGTRVESYALKVAEQVVRLLEAGVPEGNVTVMGHSKGGAIALHVASRLQRDEVQYAILAACGPWMAEAGLELRGRFLSLFDASDDLVTPCRGAVAGSWKLDEERLEIGGGHGLFFRPVPEWVERVAVFAGGPP